MTEKKIRVLVAKPGLDGHDRGAKVVAPRPARCRHGSDLHRLAADTRNDRRSRIAGGCGCGGAIHPLWRTYGAGAAHPGTAQGEWPGECARLYRRHYSRRGHAPISRRWVSPGSMARGLDRGYHPGSTRSGPVDNYAIHDVCCIILYPSRSQIAYFYSTGNIICDQGQSEFEEHVADKLLT